jgi:hypothetical protein
MLLEVRSCTSGTERLPWLHLLRHEGLQLAFKLVEDAAVDEQEEKVYDDVKRSSKRRMKRGRQSSATEGDGVTAVAEALCAVRWRRWAPQN